MANIVLINPRFEVSFWGMEHALPFMGKRASMPVSALPLLAALVPANHNVRLIDENVEGVDFDEVAKADLVGLTGMSVQRFRMREILTELKKRGAFTVVGGPWVTVNESYFKDLADVVFIGEADESWPQFLQEWQTGDFQKRYEQKERTDMAKLPTPRFDLLKMQHYLSGSVQFSRGCPFRCEFCDIIVTFGRRPRLKRIEQVIDELESLRAQNIRTVFIVDDNLIGNKKDIKALLKSVIEYQKDRDYPFRFFTETSLDLAEDAELMELMAEANITRVFIGIESPSEASLKETRKLQNIGKTASIVERVHRIQSAGIEVSAGMIMGFDSDDKSIFEAQVSFIKDARILTAMAGMLYAIPKTPLHERLSLEGRIDESDVSEYGTNVIPLRLTRDELRSGYIDVMRALYEPRAFFDRVQALFVDGRLESGRGMQFLKATKPMTWLRRSALNALAATFLLARFLRSLPDNDLARFYMSEVFRFAKARPDPNFLVYFVATCAFHYHAYRLSLGLTDGKDALVSTI
jgi:radical SAM superfamily enzyme YgiQ (UPF0313 family)